MAPSVLFNLSLDEARHILATNKMTRNHTGLLATRLSTFQSYLRQELQGIIEDCVEVAFYRCSPEVIGHAEAQAEHCDECGEYPCECDPSHDFESKDHCESCEEYWWENHDLHDCLEESEEDSCIRHKDHSGTDCQWDIGCSVHYGHTGSACSWSCDDHSEHDGETCDWSCDEHSGHDLADCDNSCSQTHSHEDWHTYLDDVGSETAVQRHAALFSGCTYATEVIPF